MLLFQVVTFLLTCVIAFLLIEAVEGLMALHQVQCCFSFMSAMSRRMVVLNTFMI